jgi:hypothetical protein
MNFPMVHPIAHQLFGVDCRRGLYIHIIGYTQWANVQSRVPDRWPQCPIFLLNGRQELFFKTWFWWWKVLSFWRQLLDFGLEWPNLYRGVLDKILTKYFGRQDLSTTLRSYDGFFYVNIQCSPNRTCPYIKGNILQLKYWS